MHRVNIYISLSVIFIGVIGLGVSGPVDRANLVGTPPATTEPSGTNPAYVSPVITATPSADGTIVHTVQYGQSLYSIAVAYGVTIDQIKALNNLTGNDIFVGNKLIIRIGSTPTITAMPSDTPTRTPRPTRTASSIPPSRTPSKTPPIIDKTQAASTQIAELPKTGSILSNLDPMLIAIAGLAVVGVGMMIAGSLLKKKP